MVPELHERDDPISRHLEAALGASDPDETRYHVREALQIRMIESTGDPSTE